MSGLEPSSQTLDLTWYRERVSFIRRNTHKYKYKFFSYKKVAPKVAPFFIRWATGGGIVHRAGKKGPWRSASPSCSTLTSARQGIRLAHRLPTSCAACWASGVMEATFMARRTSSRSRPSWRAASDSPPLFPRPAPTLENCASCAILSSLPTSLHHSATSLSRSICGNSPRPPVETCSSWTGLSFPAPPTTGNLCNLHRFISLPHQPALPWTFCATCAETSFLAHQPAQLAHPVTT